MFPGPCTAIAHGTPVWWFVVGAAARVLRAGAGTRPALVRAGVDLAHAAAAGSAPRIRRDGCRCSSNEVWRVASSWPLMVAASVADARSRARAGATARDPGARCAGQRRRMAAGCGATCCSRGIGPVYTLNYGPPLATSNQFAEQVARGSTKSARRPGRGRSCLSGTAWAAWWRARICVASVRERVAAADHHRHAAPRQHARVTLSGNAAGADAARQRVAGRNSIAMRTRRRRAPMTSIWSRHDSMVAPQASSCSPARRTSRSPASGTTRCGR